MVLTAKQTVKQLVPIDRIHGCGNLLIMLVSDLLLVQGKGIHCFPPAPFITFKLKRVIDSQALRRSVLFRVHSREIASIIYELVFRLRLTPLL